MFRFCIITVLHLCHETCPHKNNSRNRDLLFPLHTAAEWNLLHNHLQLFRVPRSQHKSSNFTVQLLLRWFLTMLLVLFSLQTVPFISTRGGGCTNGNFWGVSLFQVLGISQVFRAPNMTANKINHSLGKRPPRSSIPHANQTTVAPLDYQ